MESRAPTRSTLTSQVALMTYCQGKGQLAPRFTATLCETCGTEFVVVVAENESHRRVICQYCGKLWTAPKGDLFAA